MPPVDNNPRANLDAFQRLTRSLDKADSSQVRLSDDGSIKARSAFVTKLVSLFTRASKLEANNRAVAEAFVGAVERNLQRQVGKSLSQDWAASIVDNVRAHLADQLAGKAMLSLGDLKAQLAYLKDDLAVGVFVQTAQSQTEALKSAMDQYRASDEGKPSVEELSGKFANGGKLTADELQQVKDWHASTDGGSKPPAHPPAHQELPAVFADLALTNLVYYQGGAPWTGGALTRRVPGWPNEYVKQLPEQWAAFVDGRDWGLGVFFPGTTEVTCYRAAGQSGPAGSGCSYLAPIRTLAITNGFKLEYDVFLAIGPVSELRERFRALSGK